MARRRAPNVEQTLQNLGLSAVTVAVFLGAAEGVCRLLEWRAPPPRAVAAYLGDWQEWDDDFYTVSTMAIGQMYPGPTCGPPVPSAHVPLKKYGLAGLSTNARVAR